MIKKYALIAFIQCMSSVGSLEKSTGSAALSSGVVVDMGVAVGVKGVTGTFGGAGGKTHCQCGFGLLEDVGAVGFQGDAEGAVEVEGHGGGKDDLSSLLELSKSPKALELRGDDMLGASPAPK